MSDDRKELPREHAYELYKEIMAIDLDAIKPVTNERLWLTEFAKAMRVFLKSIGFSSRKIGVSVPNYSLASMIYIKVPYVKYVKGDYQEEDHWLRVEAERHLAKAILRAFPKNEDRSDPYTDFFDATFTFHG